MLIHYKVKFRIKDTGEIYYRECDAHNVQGALELFINVKQIIEVVML